jgi:hypothetical protein
MIKTSCLSLGYLGCQNLKLLYAKSNVLIVVAIVFAMHRLAPMIPQLTNVKSSIANHFFSTFADFYGLATLILTSAS